MLFEKGYYENLGYELFKKEKNYRDEFKSLATVSQISMLMGMIKNYKFKNGKPIEKVMEIGIFNGVTSLYMLKTGFKNTKNYTQYGIDISSEEFFGEAVLKEATREEKERYHLHLNSTALDLNNILKKDEKLDLIFIDGGHTHPLPLIDLICVLPYIHDETLLFFHDVTRYMKPNAWGESFIFEDWKDEKYRNIDIFSENQREETLGLVKIPENKELIKETILNVAKLPFRASPWRYAKTYLNITETDVEKLKNYMFNFYDKIFTEKVIDCFNKNLKQYQEEWILRVHETRFYDHLFEKMGNLMTRVSELEKRVNELENKSN